MVGPDDRPAGLDREPRHGDARAPRHSRSTIARSASAERAPGVDGVVLGRVGDAEAAAEVELGAASTPCVVARCRRAAPSTRWAATSKPTVSKICEPMWECRPSSSQLGLGQRRGRIGLARRRRSAMEKPNFWSSWAVAMNSWVCASTPAVTRTMTGRDAALRGDARRPGRSPRRVDDDPADAGVERARGSRRRTCCCRAGRSAPAGTPARSATASSPPVQTSRLQALLGHPAGDRRAEERLAGVVDVARSPSNASRNARGAGAEVVLVEDVQRRAVLGGELADVDSPATVSTPSSLRRTPAAHRCGDQLVDVARARGSQAGAAVAGSAWRTPASCARTASHPLGRRDAEQVQPVGEHLAGGVVEPQPARCRSVTSSSPCGSTRQVSYHRGSAPASSSR